MRVPHPSPAEVAQSGFPWKFGTDADRIPGEELVAAVRTFAEDLFGDDFDPATGGGGIAP
jgi:hypothetical protein